MFLARLTKYYMKISFGTKKVQKTGRVALTEALMRNAGIKVGDSVDLYFDITTKAIIVERTAAADAPATTTSDKRTKNKAGTP
jgi:ribosomal 50S subunit-recycling heat shock protein